MPDTCACRAKQTLRSDYWHFYKPCDCVPTKATHRQILHRQRMLESGLGFPPGRSRWFATRATRIREDGWWWANKFCPVCRQSSDFEMLVFSEAENRFILQPAPCFECMRESPSLRQALDDNLARNNRIIDNYCDSQ